MATKLKGIIFEDTDKVKFVRTDGKKTYYIKAYWDKNLNTWFQEGAPTDVLKENTSTVESYFYKRFAFNIKDIVNEISSRI